MSVNAAENFRHLLGKTLIENGQEAQFKKSDNQILESELPQPRRVIKPGYMYTADYIEDRLNVTINDKNKITSVKNG